MKFIGNYMRERDREREGREEGTSGGGGKEEREGGGKKEEEGRDEGERKILRERKTPSLVNSGA